jgi:hypothetical protein
VSGGGFTLTVRRSDGAEVRISGRPAWMLDRLLKAGERGLTTAELAPGLRVSDFIFKLRKHHGIAVSSERETHAGDFPGSHSIYRLSEPVEVIATEGVAS